MDIWDSQGKMRIVSGFIPWPMWLLVWCSRKEFNELSGSQFKIGIENIIGTGQRFLVQCLSFGMAEIFFIPHNNFLLGP